MNRRILAGLAASLAAILLPWTIARAGSTETAVETVAAIPVEADEDPRRISAIVVHENAPVLLDREVEVTVELQEGTTQMLLDEYLVGVLMGEMPASFELEALKAQAVAARTYTLRRMEQGGVLSDDPAVCQAFGDIETAKEKWGEDARIYEDKLRQAVRETDGLVLLYGGELISATYFSCSGGKTESAQAVWGGDVPYLVSVESPGEEETDGFESVKHVPMDEFLDQLGVAHASISSVSYTDGGGVESITIDGVTFGGTEIRSLLSLRSTMFRMEITEDEVVFYVQGYGHRVGMSQYGAQAMAEQGSTYDQILKWYYTGVEIGEYGA